MILNSLVGKTNNTNGSSPTTRGGREGDMIVSENLGRYYQKASEGDTWVVSTPLAGITLGAANTTATLGNTSQPIIAIANGNPTTNIAINKLIVSTLSGTPAAGTWWWAILSGQSAATFTALTSSAYNSKTWMTSTDLGISSKIGINQALTGLTGTLVPNRIAGNLGTVTAALGTFQEEIAGSIIIPYNSIACLLAPGAGTTHIVHASAEIITVVA
jgi:hypothetical protein